MMQSNELFTDRDREEIYAFFRTRDRWRDIVRWRTLEHGPVDTVFYGDSIFELWPTAEAFPELSHLNRGIGGDNINGLYFRLDEDIFPNSPRQVVINIGINGIERDFNDSIARLKFVAELMREHGIRVTAVCPAGVATDLYGLTPRWQRIGTRLGVLITADSCARRGLRALWRGRRCIVPDWWNRVWIPLCKILPMWALRPVRRFTMKFQK